VNDIYEYEDFRRYVSDWLGEKKGRSQRKLAKHLGLAPSTLSQVFKADSASPRRLPERVFPALCQLIDLDDQESRFLVAMIEYGQAITEAEAEQAFEKMSALLSFQFGRGMSDRQYELFSAWHHNAIHELAHCAGFRADPEWIAATLMPPITAAQAQSSLDLLAELGMLEPDDELGLRPAAGILIDNQWGTASSRREAARKHHRQMLARAADVMDELGPDERLVIGATVAVATVDVERARARLLAAVQEILEMSTGATSERDQVVEVMCQLFPLSRKTT